MDIVLRNLSVPFRDVSIAHQVKAHNVLNTFLRYLILFDKIKPQHLTIVYSNIH